MSDGSGSKGKAKKNAQRNCRFGSDKQSNYMNNKIKMAKEVEDKSDKIKKSKKDNSSWEGRRCSGRLKNQINSAESGKIALVDSAYDGDAELSQSTSHSEGDDPYSFSALNETPLESAIGKNKKKKIQTKKGSQHNTQPDKGNSKKGKATGKRKAASSAVIAHASSTPNQTVETNKRRRVAACDSSPLLNSTPEVTPILPVPSGPVSAPPIVGQDFSTPQLYVVIKKLSPSPVLVGSSGSVTSSSHGDSGIAGLDSPPAKRSRLQGQPVSRHKSAAVLGKKLMNKRNIFSPNSKSKQKEETEVATFGLKLQTSSKISLSKPANQRGDPKSDSAAKENMDTSCFGFNNNSPPIPTGVKRKLPSITEYRCADTLVTSESSPDRPSSPLASPSQVEQGRQSSSPGLFSDDMFSADSGAGDSLLVNRTFSKTYNKGSKVKPLKSKKSISKFEAWANEKNMEIEDIEKFDLNIE